MRFFFTARRGATKPSPYWKGACRAVSFGVGVIFYSFFKILTNSDVDIPSNKANFFNAGADCKDGVRSR